LRINKSGLKAEANAFAAEVPTEQALRNGIERKELLYLGWKE
jgi:hypothetical protein